MEQSQIRVLVVPCDGTPFVKILENDPSAIDEEIGATAVQLPVGDVYLCFDQHGKAKGLPSNPTATRLLHKYSSLTWCEVGGKALLVGRRESSIEKWDVPQTVVDELIDPEG